MHTARKTVTHTVPGWGGGRSNVTTGHRGGGGRCCEGWSHKRFQGGRWTVTWSQGGGRLLWHCVPGGREVLWPGPGGRCQRPGPMLEREVLTDTCPPVGLRQGGGTGTWNTGPWMGREVLWPANPGGGLWSKITFGVCPPPPRLGQIRILTLLGKT